MCSSEGAATTSLQRFWNKNHYIRIKSVEKSKYQSVLLYESFYSLFIEFTLTLLEKYVGRIVLIIFKN